MFDFAVYVCVCFLQVLAQFLSFPFMFFKSIAVYQKLGSRLTFLLAFPLTFYCYFYLRFIAISVDFFIDVSLDISIDNFDMLIDILTDKEEGGGRKEGVDFFLKSNNPTPEGGELSKNIRTLQATTQNTKQLPNH